MKNTLSFLCMLVVLATFKGQAQWPNQVDTSFAGLIIPNTEDVGIAVKGNNTIIRIEPDNSSDGIMLVNGVPFDAIRLNSDDPSSTSASSLITFAEDSDSTFVVSGYPELMIGQLSTARARITNIANPDSTELALSFYNSGTPTDLNVKGVHLNDSILYLLVNGITGATSVEVVLNNGQPQPGTALTSTGAAFLKVDRSTGAVLKQVYFNHNANDSWLNITHFNNNSLLKQGNRFFFTSVSSRNENFMLHIYDTDLNLVNDIPIATDSCRSITMEAEQHFADRVIGYGEYDGQEYIGLVPKTIPVVVNLTTLDVNYIDAGNVFNGYASARSVFFVDNAFVFLGSWIKRVELGTMTPSVIRRDWITSSPALSGKGMSAAQRNARLGGAGFSAATLVNGQIEYYGIHRILNSASPPSAMYINGEQVPVGTLASGDAVVYRGSLGLLPEGPPGTETVFASQNSVEAVQLVGNRVIYTVDSADIRNVHVTRTTGPNNAGISPSASAVVDFSNDTNIVVFSVDYPSPNDISTIRVYVESAVAVVSGDVSLREEETGPFLYPNPFVDRLNIPEMYRNRNYGLILYDISGKVALRKSNIGNGVHVSHLVSGVYVVHIIDDHGNIVTTQKIVK